MFVFAWLILWYDGHLEVIVKKLQNGRFFRKMVFKKIKDTYLKLNIFQLFFKCVVFNDQ